MSDPLAPNKYEVRARSLYIQASVAWMAGQIAETGGSLLHYIGVTLEDARATYPTAKEWEFVALARRIERIVDADYGPPPPEWTPRRDDSHAWALDAEAQQGIDEWGY